jgi:hypothetical protein
MTDAFDSLIDFLLLETNLVTASDSAKRNLRYVDQNIGQTIAASSLSPVGVVTLLNSGNLILPNGTEWSPSLPLSSSFHYNRLRSPSRCDVLQDYGFSAASSFHFAWDTRKATLSIIFPTSPQSPKASRDWLALPLSSPNAPNQANWTWNPKDTQVSVVTANVQNITKVLDMDFNHYSREFVLLAQDLDGKEVLTSITFEELISGGIVKAHPKIVFSSPNAPFSLDGGQKGATPRVEFMPSHSGLLFVYGDAIGMSADGGSTMFPIQLVTRNPNLLSSGVSALQPNEFIYQVTYGLEPSFTDQWNRFPISTDDFNDYYAPSMGKYAILTSMNRVFIGSIGLPKAYEIKTLLLESNVAKYYINFRFDGSLVAVTQAGVSPYITAIKIRYDSQLR